MEGLSALPAQFSAVVTLGKSFSISKPVASLEWDWYQFLAELLLIPV